MNGITQYKNVFVHGDSGLVVDKHCNLIDHPLNSRYWRDIWRPRFPPSDIQQPPEVVTESLSIKVEHMKAMVRDDQVIELEEQKYCFALPWFTHYAYGHVHDTTQYLKDYEDNGLTGSTLLVRAETPHISNFFSDHLHMFGFNSLRILPRTDKVFFVKEITFSNHDTFPSQIDPNKLEWLRQKYYKKYKPEKKFFNKNLFLTRSRRVMLNEDEIWNYLKDKNFIKVDGSEGLARHISLFHKPNLVIGCHGSLFRNLLYSNRDNDSVYYEYCSRNRPDQAQVMLAKTCGIKKYEQILVDADKEDNIAPNLKKIKNIVENTFKFY